MEQGNFISKIKTKYYYIFEVVSVASLFLTLVGLDYCLRFMHEGSGITSYTSVIPHYFTLCWAGLLCAVVFILPKLFRQIATGIVGGLSCILLLTHSMMMHAKGNFFSFSSLMFAGDGFKFLDSSYIAVRKLVWVVFAVAVIGTIVSILCVPKVKYRKLSKLIRLIIVIIIIAAAIILINVNRDVNVSDRTAVHFNIYQAGLIYDDFSDSNQSLMLAGLYQYTFRDICLTYGIYDVFSRVSEADTIKSLDEWYDNKIIDEDNEYTGLFKDKNLIFIQLEAIDTWLINETCMPNLYKIQSQSINFTQNYTPIYLDAGTFNTEMIVNTGLVSPFQGSKASMYSRNYYPYSLANLFSGEGYNVNSFHRSTGDVYNRAEVHENIGYTHYYSGEEMGMELLDFDTELMHAYDKITDGKFMSYIITYSGHGPYEGSMVSEKYYDLASQMLPDETNKMKIHAYAHAYATDLFIGELFEQMEKDGTIDDTVVIFYSDHYDYYTLDTELVMEEKGATDTNFITRTPFIIYSKDIEAQNVDKVVSSIDVLPTIVNLFDLDTDGRYYVGNDAFSDNGGYVIFSDYSWWDGETYRYALDNEDITDEMKERDTELRNRLEITWDTLKTNYFETK